MNFRPDYVTESWLRCLGLSGKAARAVMDVHTDQLNALRDEIARLREANAGYHAQATDGFGNRVPVKLMVNGVPVQEG